MTKDVKSTGLKNSISIEYYRQCLIIIGSIPKSAGILPVVQNPYVTYIQPVGNLFYPFLSVS